MKLIHKDGYGIFIRKNFLYFSTGENFYCYDFDQVIEIPKEEYLVQKYGKENQFWTAAFDEVVYLRNGDFITTFYQENEIRLHHSDGTIKKMLKKINSPFEMGIYGMTIDKNEKLWIAVPTEHYIGQFDLHSEKELFSINGIDLEPTVFDHPEYVTAIGDFVYVADMGNRRIVKIHIQSYERQDFKKLAEPVYYFNQLNGKNIYLLQSGIYVA